MTKSKKSLTEQFEYPRDLWENINKKIFVESVHRNVFDVLETFEDNVWQEGSDWNSIARWYDEQDRDSTAAYDKADYYANDYVKLMDVDTDDETVTLTFDRDLTDEERETEASNICRFALGECPYARE